MQANIKPRQEVSKKGAGLQGAVFDENQYLNVKNIMIYGYIRVSSDKQTVENQRFEINKFCEKQNIVINDWIEETISGTKNYTKRQLGNLLKKVHKDDIIICSELSRLGRNLFMIMEILNICMTKECRVSASD